MRKIGPTAIGETPTVAAAAAILRLDIPSVSIVATSSPSAAIPQTTIAHLNS